LQFQTTSGETAALVLDKYKLEHMASDIDSTGKSGDTQCPFPWQVVEEYCQEQLPTRLHARAPRVRFEVVPKDLGQNDDDVVIQSKRLKDLFKRKASEDNDSWQKQRPSQRKRVETEERPEQGRPVSEEPEVVHWGMGGSQEHD
jgi:hypothetical protein